MLLTVFPIFGDPIFLFLNLPFIREICIKPNTYALPTTSMTSLDLNSKYFKS